MKTTSFILSILILAISLLPCADGLAHEHDEDSVTTEQVEHSHSDSDEDHEDGCSPFCTCSCCGMAITVPPLVDSNTKVDQPESDYNTAWSDDITLEFHSTIWHPPADC